MSPRIMVAASAVFVLGLVWIGPSGGQSLEAQEQEAPVAGEPSLPEPQVEGPAVAPGPADTESVPADVSATVPAQPETEPPTMILIIVAPFGIPLAAFPPGVAPAGTIPNVAVPAPALGSAPPAPAIGAVPAPAFSGAPAPALGTTPAPRFDARP